MKKIVALLVSMALLVGVAVSPVWAAGDKNRNSHGATSAPGDGPNAKGNQSSR